MFLMTVNKLAERIAENVRHLSFVMLYNRRATILKTSFENSTHRHLDQSFMYSAPQPVNSFSLATQFPLVRVALMGVAEKCCARQSADMSRRSVEIFERVRIERFGLIFICFIILQIYMLLIRIDPTFFFLLITNPI